MYAKALFISFHNFTVPKYFEYIVFLIRCFEFIPLLIRMIEHENYISQINGKHIELSLQDK